MRLYVNTYTHTDGRSTSVLDHWFVNSRLLPLIEDAGVLHFADNPSDHSPIMLKVRVGDIQPRSDVSEVPRPRRPAWYRASDDNKNTYTSTLDDKIRHIVESEPDSLNCHNCHCQILRPTFSTFSSLSKLS